MRILMKLVLAAAVLLVAHTAQAGWFAEITFAPQPYFGGPVMVYRGDWVPYQYAYPSYRPAPRGYYPPQYNRSRYQPSHNRPCPHRHGR